MVDPGLVVVDKSPGMTSHDVVARVRRLAGTRKVGHAGTLDPMATGVLVLGVDRATRLLGHLTALRRTAVGSFDLSVARTLDELAGGVEVLPIADAARRTFPVLELTGEQAAHVRFGRALDLEVPDPGPHAVFAPDGEFLALYEPREGLARPVAVFV